MKQLLFIAGPTAIGKRTLASRLLESSEFDLRAALGIDEPATVVGYARSVEEIGGVDERGTGIVLWQGMADAFVSEVGDKLPNVRRRIATLWRPFRTHWRAYRDKTVSHAAGLHPDAHAADWMELCLTHRRSIYGMLEKHEQVERVILDADDGYARLDSLPDDCDPFMAGVRPDLAHLVGEASRLGLPGTDGAWLPYTSFTVPGFTYDRTYRDSRQRLEWFGIPQDLRGVRALEIASHCGAIGLEFASLGASVVGLEREPESVAVANELAGRLGLNADFRQFNADTDQYPSDSFDLVFCGSLDHWINERDRLYTEVARLARDTCYFESNEVSRHDWLDGFFAERFRTVQVLPHSPGNRRLYVLKKA